MDNNNMVVYDKVKFVPDNAKKAIQAGRIAGFTDINPMWRIKMLTETFGVCGIGWKYTITKQWLESHGEDVKAFCNIDLFVKVDGEWSDAIPGTGGSSFVTKERNGAYVSDECWKMALTDAISVACKALGMAADVYYSADSQTNYMADSKYQQTQDETNTELKALMVDAKDEIDKAKSIEEVNAVNTKYMEKFKDHPDIAKRFSALVNETCKKFKK